MAQANVLDLQVSLANYIDQTNTAPSQGGTDWNYRLNLLNRAQQDWALAYEWPHLYKEINALTSLATGQASISLPADFRKLATLFQYNDGMKTWSAPEIDAPTRTRYLGIVNTNVNLSPSAMIPSSIPSSNPYCYVLGNPANGWTLVNVPGTYPSGASLFYGYWAYPTSLASATDVSQCPEPEYLVTRALSLYFQAKEDGRFQDMRAEADRYIGEMIDKAATQGYGGNKAVLMQDDGWRWGD